MWISASEEEARTFRHGAEAIRRQIRCKRIAEFQKQVWDDGSQAFIGKFYILMIQCFQIEYEIILCFFVVFMVVFPCLQFVICYIGAYLLQYIHYG